MSFSKQISLMILLIITFSISYSISAAEDIDAGRFMYFDKQLKSETAEGFSANQFFVNTELSKDMINATDGKLTLHSFPVSPGRTATVELNKKSPVVDGRTEWLRGTDDGILPAEGVSISSFSGRIQGEKDSKVYLNFSNGKFFAIIESKSGQYSLAPDELKSPRNSTLSAHTVSSVDWSEISKSISQFCATPDEVYEVAEERKIKTDKESIQSKKLLQADIIVEAEYFYYTLKGSDYEAAAEYIVNVMQLASKIYEENINVTFYVPQILIWEEPNGDPYNSELYLHQKLYRMPGAWKNNSAKRALTVLFADLNRQPGSYRVAGISFGGQPYTGSVCSIYRGYCVFGIHGNFNYPTTRYTWDVSVAAHEMGHNFSAPHTHNCFFSPNMIDTCITATKPYDSDGCVEVGDPVPRPGTIMSYCHLTNSTKSVQLFFHERVKPLIRTAAENASCIDDPDEPMVSLLFPLGDTLMPAGKLIEITWTSSMVNYVDLKYSTDGGENWNKIKNGIEASAKSYYWEAPLVNSGEMLILIEDSFDTEISDKSLLHFSIKEPAISVLKPDINEKIRKGSNYTIEYEKAFVENAKILFSSNGGENWNEVASGVDLLNYRWDVPEIESDNCLIKIVDEDNDLIAGISRKFAIGAATAELIYPVAGESFCFGDEVEVQWNGDFIEKISLFYSVDGGDSWKKAFIAPLDINIGTFSWSIPEVATDEGMFRIAAFPDNNTVLAETDGKFKIDSCLTGITYQTHNKLTLVEIYPNPADDIAKIKLNAEIQDGSMPDFHLMTPVGRMIEINADAASGNFEIDLSNFAQGTYYLITKINGRTIAAPLTILR